jgi:5-bromo-4-chloroindolyl phosphate hydrolysis protein
MTQLGQRLNRVFFFLARYHKCSNYFGYKRTRGEGYDYANEIGLTDEDFKGIMEQSGDDIPSEITKLHRKIIVKIHPNRMASSAPVIKIYNVERLDGTVVQRETQETVRDDSGYSYSRYNDMYNNFRKWYANFKKNPAYLKEERKYFLPVNNTVDWKDYEERTLNPIRYKEWFDL